MSVKPYTPFREDNPLSGASQYAKRVTALRGDGDRTGTERSGSAGAGAAAPLGNTANYSSTIIRHDREELKKARLDLRLWARKAALFGVDNPLEAHRVALCGWATANGVSGVGVRVSDGVAGFAGLQTCGSVWGCPVCAAKISARRAEELGAVLGWARTEGHTLAMVTLTVSHQRQDRLKSVWDAVASGWGAITSGQSWNGEETEEEFAERLGQWVAQGNAHDDAKRRGAPAPRAPRGWHKGNAPKIRLGDKAKYGVLGWARAVEVTRGSNGWHVHIHAVIVLNGNQKSYERAYSLGDSMRTRWNAGIGKKGFKSADEYGVRVDVSEGAEQRLADYLAKSSEPEKAVKQSMEKAGRDLAREATLGQHKQGKKGGRTPFQILADLQSGVSEDWALWNEWLVDSKGRQQLTWSADLREMAGLLLEETDQEIAAEEVGTAEDTVLVLPIESWREVRNDPETMVKILMLAERSTYDLKMWLDSRRLAWLPRGTAQE